MPPLPPRLSLAADHIDAGRLDQARSVLQRFLAAEPRNPIAHGMMGFAMARLGEPRLAVYHIEQAIAADPDNADLYANLGNTHLSTGNLDAAIRGYRRGLQIQAGHRSSTVGLINALNARSSFAEADQVGATALAAHPNHPELLINRAATLLSIAHADQAVELLRRAAALRPDDPAPASSLANAMNYLAGAAPRDTLAAHVRFGSLLHRASRPPAAPPRATEPDRPLRVGLVSADLRSHAVGFFIEPWLTGYDRAAFSVVCYSTSLREDAASQRFRGLVSRWHTVPQLGMDQLADLIRRDRIDILLDLSGLTPGHRLPLLPRRVAPVQATYLGYPNTTGIRACDYRIVDGLTDPAPDADSLTVERLIRLDPCFLCYRLPSDAPEVSQPPFEPQGHIAFGSFNSLQKFNDTLLQAWAKVLAAVPNARLVLKARELADASIRDRIADRLERQGIDRSRLDVLEPTASHHDHLAAYAHVDIALDTFPYNGTTTTCEALAMGVPVVTIAGHSHAGRVGVSLLSAAGLPGLTAPDTESYIQIATTLAGDRQRIADLRRSLRSRVMSSALGDTRAFSARMDTALRTMWRQACARP